MRRLLYIIVLLSLLAVPAERMDVSKLMPVELVAVDYQMGLIEISTDTGNKGVGKTVAEAYQNLRESASGTVFLDTANYLLLCGKSGGLLKELKKDLRPGVRFCMAQSGLDLQEAALYLSEHPPKHRLKDSQYGVNPQTLVQTNTGFLLR